MYIVRITVKHGIYNVLSKEKNRRSCGSGVLRVSHEGVALHGLQSRW